MNDEIVKTIIHLKDDKGWNNTHEIAGDFHCGTSYFVRKRYRLNEAPLVLTKNMDYPIPEQLACQDYEFILQKQMYVRIRKNGKKFAKHLYYEIV